VIEIIMVVALIFLSIPVFCFIYSLYLFVCDRYSYRDIFNPERTYSNRFEYEEKLKKENCFEQFL
jgi:hypothetical protein